jgi:hypothetical protein
MTKKTLSCKQPDRDEPRLVCGYPLPCPYHTVIVTETQVRVPIRMQHVKDRAKQIRGAIFNDKKL